MSGKQIGNATVAPDLSLFIRNVGVGDWVNRRETEIHLFGSLFKNCPEAYAYCVEWERSSPRA